MPIRSNVVQGKYVWANPNYITPSTHITFAGDRKQVIRHSTSEVGRYGDKGRFITNGLY